MFLTSGPLELRVRPQNVLGRKDTAPYQIAALEQWQKDLPLANPAELARLLYEKLELVNRAELSAKDRYRSLDAMRRPIHQLNEQIHHQHLFKAGLLSERERKLSTMLLVIYNELGVGYNTVLTEMLESSSRYYNEEITLSAAARAIDCINYSLQTSLRLYNPDPKYIWHELHRIYHFLEQNKLLDSNLRNQGWDSLTPSTLYKRCLLLSAANLYQLHSNQVKAVLELIEQLAPLCLLNPYTEQTSGLVVDLDKDDPPIHRDLLKGPAQTGWRILQLEPALDYLQQQLSGQNLPKGITDVGSGNGIWHHLLRAWGALSKRSFARAPYHAQAQVCIGLASSHYYLLEESDEFDQATRNSFIKELHGDDISQSFAVKPAQIQKTNIGRGKDPWDLMQRNRMQKLAQQNQQAQNKTAEAGAKVQYPLQPGMVVNISPNGYRLAIQPPYPQQLQIGELVAIKETQENHRVLWHLGSICWLRHLGAEIHLGIRLLAPMATPLIYQSPVLVKTGSKPTKRTSQRALLLPSLKGIAQPSTLLGSASLKEQQEIEVRNSHESFWVRLTRLLHATHSYRQFEFERIEGPSQTTEPITPSTPEAQPTPRKRLWSRF